MTKKYMKHIDECGMYYYICNGEEIIAEAFYGDDAQDIVDLLNEQNKRIKELESENKILKTTISRNEAYINQIKTIGKWSNTGDVE